MKDGELIRKLREERNITQEELVRGQFSRSGLSRIESEKIDIKTDMLICFLDRMNITLEEYQVYKYGKTNNLSKKEEVKEEFYKKISNEKSGDEFLKYVYQMHKQSNDIYYLHLYCQGRALQYKINNKTIDLSVEGKIIKNHLDKIDSWGYFEFSMYANCLFLFPDKFIEGQYKSVLQKTKKFSHSPRFKHLKIRFLINSLILSFERDNLYLVDTYLKELFESTHDIDHLFGRVFWGIFKDLNNSIKNDEYFDVTFIYNYLRYLDYNEFAEDILEITKFAKK